MVGYPESLTDPSYRGQILVLTYPLIGNYGVPAATEVDENGLPLFFESDRVQISALVVGSYGTDFSHWRAVRSLGDWLKASNVPAIHGVDTRALTKRLRTKGVMLGKIVLKSDPHGGDLPFEDPNRRNLVAEGTFSTPDLRRAEAAGGRPRAQCTAPCVSITADRRRRVVRSLHQAAPSFQAHCCRPGGR